jgi:hypothetical protein
MRDMWNGGKSPGSRPSRSQWDVTTMGADDQSDSEPQALNDPGRRESEEEREDRNLIELLQELRVASIGTQVLFGFLLSVPFSVRFVKLGADQRLLYLATLLLAALGIGLLSSPVAYHRAVFRQHKKERLLRITTAMALSGLAVIGLAISLAVLLVAGLVFHGLAVPLSFVLTAGMFAVLWILGPVASRLLTTRQQGRQ